MAMQHCYRGGAHLDAVEPLSEAVVFQIEHLKACMHIFHESTEPNRRSEIA
jgi:hypothetical protein